MYIYVYIWRARTADRLRSWPRRPARGKPAVSRTQVRGVAMRQRSRKRERESRTSKKSRCGRGGGLQSARGGGEDAKTRARLRVPRRVRRTPAVFRFEVL